MWKYIDCIYKTGSVSMTVPVVLWRYILKLQLQHFGLTIFRQKVKNANLSANAQIFQLNMDTCHIRSQQLLRKGNLPYRLKPFLNQTVNMLFCCIVGYVNDWFVYEVAKGTYALASFKKEPEYSSFEISFSSPTIPWNSYTCFKIWFLLQP